MQPILLWGSCRPTVGVQPVLPWGSRGPTVGVGARGLWGLTQETIEVDVGSCGVAKLASGDGNLLLYYFTFLLFGRLTYQSIRFIIYYIYNKNII